jgi:hypothetical protein
LGTGVWGWGLTVGVFFWFCVWGLGCRVYVAAESRSPGPTGTPTGSNAKSLFVITPPFIQPMRPW